MTKVDPMKRLPISMKGRGLRKCKLCGTARGSIKKYGLNICRRCFREVAPSLGFKKFG